ncbi:hypothetical protein Pint_16750 [Pistacia integerrima]|uniref:Uncharacterized protein n=1 Tax=Pistacia integerrima TaxID=434235 RepID=A0ACC0ZAA2_9ROSI|nr:hypothetical protein Pint_16750 [Pistacia integerrima]
MEEERLQRLQNSAAEGNVDTLFSILAEDPNVLELINRIPFVTTPLHTAASCGKVHFSREIVNLKPSFASKRDRLGRSPLHLALEGKKLQQRRSPRDLDLEENYQEIVTWLIHYDRELVLVTAKGWVTPLHYAAEIDDESSLADFLYVCPSSIRKATVKWENAVHVALKNGSLRAFKVLIGWLRRFDREPILYSEDEDGNNALHTAISENQPEAVKLLIKYMEVNRKNGRGLTALDIFYDRQGSLNPEVGEILRGAKAKRASQLHPQHKPPKSLADYFRSDLSFMESILKRLGLGDQSIKTIPFKVRNVMLVVVVLITTATYETALSPPGELYRGVSNGVGNLQPANNSTAISNTATTTIFPKGPPKLVDSIIMLRSYVQLIFSVLNFFAFFTSLCSLSILITGLPFSSIISASMCLMVCSFYFAAMEILFYQEFTNAEYTFLMFLLAISALAAYCIPVLMKGQEDELTIQGWQRKLSLGSFKVQTTKI